MKILFDINHPSYVHVFKHVIRKLEKEGHTCLVTARKKDVTHELLKAFEIPFISTGKTPEGTAGKILRGMATVFHLIWIVISKRVGLVVSMESPYAVIAAFLCMRKSVTVADTETAGLIHRITGPLSTYILVPSCFKKRLSKKQTSFEGYKELAYLHPHLFIPDFSIVAKNNIPSDKPYAIIRFVAFKASHDKGHRGFSEENKVWLINNLIGRMNVYISSEGPLPKGLENFRLKADPADIHHILAFASLYAGDSTTMAAEAAVLGVPSICLNDNDLGYLTELSEKYGLLFKYHASEEDQEKAVNKAFELAQLLPLEEWGEKRRVMLSQKVDVAGVIGKIGSL